MSQQTLGTSTFSPIDPPVKRKRGRPRKDDSPLQGENTPVVPGSDSVKKNKQISNATIDDMVGQVVSGVIEGSFDAGYLLNVKVGDTDTQLRGVVFLPGRVTPITAANDVAPNAKMYERKEIPIPVQNPQTQRYDFVPPSEQINKKASESKMDAPKFSDQVPPYELQSGVPTAGENQSDSIKMPLADNSQMNETGQSLGEKTTLQKISKPGLESQTAPIMAGPSFGEKVTLQQILEPGLESQTASIMEELKHYKVVEPGQVQQSNMDVEASKQSGPVCAPFVGITPLTENFVQEPHIEHQVLSSDLKPSDLFHDEVKSLNFVDNQTAALTELKSLSCEDNQTAVSSKVKSLNFEDNQTAVPTKPESVSSEPMGLGFLMDNPNIEHNQILLSAEPKSFSSQLIGANIMIEKQNSPRKDAPEDTLLELANKTIGDNTSFSIS